MPSRVTVKINRNEKDNLHGHSALPVARKQFKLLTGVLSFYYISKCLGIYVGPVTSLVIQAAAGMHCLRETMTQQNAGKDEVQLLAFAF